MTAQKHVQPKNEGEGSRTAARQYNEAAKKFAQSGKVDKAAKDAERAIEGDEAKELKRAEDKGRVHAAPHEQKREI
ncbi:MAG: hypothetical protein AB7F41_07495 [Methylocystis sp.]|uniref:hypothetical protein n=1 Tax=Methylocystis sp. TaxID=1911079 RepID=UPI003D1498EC